MEKSDLEKAENAVFFSTMMNLRLLGLCQTNKQKKRHVSSGKNEKLFRSSNKQNKKGKTGA